MDGIDERELQPLKTSTLQGIEVKNFRVGFVLHSKRVNETSRLFDNERSQRKIVLLTFFVRSRLRSFLG